MRSAILVLAVAVTGVASVAAETLFTCNWSSSSGTVVIEDGRADYEHTSSDPDARFSLTFDFPSWETDAYILMPACAYNGNRDARQKPAGHKPSGACMPDGVGLEPVLYHPEYPCLNPDGSGEIEVLSGDMSVPIVGVYFREKKRGFFLFTEQQIGDRNLGYSVKSGSIRVDFPGNRKKAYLLPKNVDPPLSLKTGDRLTARFRTLTFAADSLPAFLERFFRERKSFLGDRHAPNGYTKELWDMVERCWNEKLFVDGAYRQERWKWEPGWTGGPVSVYPLYQLGSELTKARCRETLDFLVRNQAKSGFYYACIVGNERRPDGSGPRDHPNRTFVRRSPEALYFLIRCARMMGWKDAWRDSARKCADALVRTWRRYGQFGQWIDVETGDLIVGRSTSAAIVSAALLEAWREFGVSDYREIAFAACEDYCRRDLDRGITYGGPGDILMTPDSESAFGLLESCVALAEETKDPHWIARARQAAALASTWVVSYRYKFPPTSAFAKLGVNTVGSVWASCRNKHSAPGICTLSGDSLLRLYRLTKDEAYLELCKDIAFFLPQVVARPDRPILVHPEIRHRGANLEPGFMCERVNMSDWEHYDWIGEVYNHPCWCGTCLTTAYADLLTQPEFKEECK